MEDFHEQHRLLTKGQRRLESGDDRDGHWWLFDDRQACLARKGQWGWQPLSEV